MREGGGKERGREERRREREGGRKGERKIRQKRKEGRKEKCRREKGDAWDVQSKCLLGCVRMCGVC